MPNPPLTTRRPDVIIPLGTDSRLNWSHYMRVLDAMQDPGVRAYRIISHPLIYMVPDECIGAPGAFQWLGNPTTETTP